MAGRVALVTGAETLRAIEEVGSTAVEIEADVSDEADVERLFAEGQAACGPVSVCVSNAGCTSNGRSST